MFKLLERSEEAQEFCWRKKWNEWMDLGVDGRKVAYGTMLGPRRC